MTEWIAVTDHMPPGTYYGVLAVHVPHAGPRCVVRARWVPRWFEDSDFDDGDGVGEYSETDDCYYWPEGWYELTEAGDGTLWRLPGAVTHWMRLPALPARSRSRHELFPVEVPR